MEFSWRYQLDKTKLSSSGFVWVKYKAKLTVCENKSSKNQKCIHGNIGILVVIVLGVVPIFLKVRVFCFTRWYCAHDGGHKNCDATATTTDFASPWTRKTPNLERQKVRTPTSVTDDKCGFLVVKRLTAITNP